MVTYFNKKDLIKFGNFLLKNRKERIEKAVVEQQISPEHIESDDPLVWDVTHADVRNFLDQESKVD